MRAVEEKAAALRRLSERWHERYPRMGDEYRDKADQMDASAAVLRRLLAEGAV